ncbi:MAG: hypothetical protein VX498_09755, partial [Myxococcota bacterium]|nr:hypothetical protein [Myxococcota bacterium]
ALKHAEVGMLARRAELDADADSDEPAIRDLHRKDLELSLVHALRLRGRLRLAVGDTGLALLRLREAGERWQELQGDDHPGGATFLISLAQALRGAGRGSELEEPLESARVLAGGEMDRVPQPTLPIVLHDLGVAAGDAGDFEHAETLLVEAAMLAASLLKDGDPIHARILYTRGLARLARGENDLAEGLFADAEKRSSLEGRGRGASMLLIQAARAWARAGEGRDRHGEAARVLRETEEELVKLRGPENTIAAHVRGLRRSLE